MYIKMFNEINVRSAESCGSDPGLYKGLLKHYNITLPLLSVKMNRSHKNRTLQERYTGQIQYHSIN